MISTVTSLAVVIAIFVPSSRIDAAYGQAEMPLCTRERGTAHAYGGTVHSSATFGRQFLINAERSDGDASGVGV